MAAQWQQPRSGPADVALRERDVADLLDDRDRVAVLGQPHRPAEDRGLRLAQHLRRPRDLRPGQPGGRRDRVPVHRPDMIAPRLEAVRVRLDELVVERVPLDE